MVSEPSARFYIGRIVATNNSNQSRAQSRVLFGSQKVAFLSTHLSRGTIPEIADQTLHPEQHVGRTRMGIAEQCSRRRCRDPETRCMLKLLGVDSRLRYVVRNPSV